MSDLKVCRVCLRAQCKVYKYDQFQLQAYYEEVTAQKMNDADGLPLYFCYECATILHKFHKFKEKCWIGQSLLKKIQLSCTGNINYEIIHNIDRAAYHLKSPLQILTVTKHVKTYVIEDIQSETESESELMETEDEKKFSIEDKELDIVDKEIKEQIDNINETTAFENDYDSDTPLEDLKNFEIENPVTPEIVDNCEKKIDEIDCKIEKLTSKNISNIDEDEENALSSPQTVFVDVKKDVIVLKSEPIKERKKSSARPKKINPRFIKPKVNYPDKDSWKIHTLTEEEAVKEFQLRAENKKYKNAAFKCVDCFKGFSKEDMLKRHKQLRHSEGQGQVECRFCHKRFKWDSKLRRHMVEHFTRYTCLQCNIVVCVETTALLHEEYHKGVVKRCHHCGEEFRHRSTYYTHLRTHRSGHVCALCGMSFVSPSGLQMHTKIKHIDGNGIPEDDDDAPVNTFCVKCDIRFETRNAYEEHLFHSALHSDGANADENTRKILGKRSQEIILGKRKRKKIRWIIDDNGTHVRRTSTDDELPAKPKKGLRQKRNRRKQKKPTTCIQCGKHFESQSACMKHHHEQHPRTPFYSERHICEICGASLALGSVAMHQNMHSRENLFPCEICGRKFHTLAGLKRHMVTHTGEKPYACSLCDKRFTQSNSCKLHYNTFHLKKPYPKRNRRKRKDIPEVPPEDNSSSEDSSPEQPGTEPATSRSQEPNENLHYLTLS